MTRRKSKRKSRSTPVRDGTTVSEESTGSGRRSFLAGIGGFAGGVIAAVAGGYLTDYFKAISPPGEEADRNTSEAPMRAVVLRERDIGSQGELWIFPYRLSAQENIARAVAAGFKNDDERIRFFYRHGAIDPNITSMKLVVEGRRNSGVRVIDIRAKIHKKSEPLADCTLFTPGPQGASASAMIGFDLDGPETSALQITDGEFVDVFTEEYFGEPYFTNETFGLNRTEQQVFQITARTTKYYVEWFIEVVLLVDNAEEVYQFGINDRPIITTALYPRDGLADMRNLVIPQEDRYAEVYVDSRFTDQTATESTSAVFLRKK